jgi:hypothetical protein
MLPIAGLGAARRDAGANRVRRSAVSLRARRMLDRRPEQGKCLQPWIAGFDV